MNTDHPHPRKTPCCAAEAYRYLAPHPVIVAKALADILRAAEADILTLHPPGTPLSHAPLFLADRLEEAGFSLIEGETP